MSIKSILTNGTICELYSLYVELLIPKALASPSRYHELFLEPPNPLIGFIQLILLHLHPLPPYLIVLHELCLELPLHVPQPIEVLRSELLVLIETVRAFGGVVIGLFNLLVSLKDLWRGHFVEVGQAFASVS